MSTFVIHLLIPPLMALAVRFFPYRYVWTWVWVSVIPDVDYLGWILHAQNENFPNFHRALFHNVFILILLVGLAVYRFRAYRASYVGSPGQAFGAYARTKAGAGLFLSSYYYFSHLLLDSFQGGFAPFWPVNNQSIYYFFELNVNTQTQEIIPTAETGVVNQVVDVSPIYTWLTSEQFAFVLLLLVSILVGHAYRRIAQPVVVVRAVQLPRPPTALEPPA